MKLPTLYTLDKKKKVRVFGCEVIKDEIMTKASLPIDSTDQIYIIHTETGLLDGKLTGQDTLVLSGKQGRTTKEQAEFQAKSLWESKLDEGYKSWTILKDKYNSECKGLDSHIPKEDNNETRDRIYHLFNRFPESSYTNGNWDELPMLAHKFKDIKKPNFPYYIQRKLNGVRCLCKIKIFNNGSFYIKLISRGGSYYKVPHIENQLINLIERTKQISPGFTDFILDGELYKHGRPLQEISGAARTQEDTTLFASNDWLEYHIYDVINLNCLDNTYTDRYIEFCSIRASISEPNIKFVDTSVVDHPEEITHYHNIFVEEGYEGAILRDPNALYTFNERSRGLLKVKNFQDEEFVIIGHEIDDTKSVGESFVFILRNNINSKTFKARPTGTEEMKEYWNDHPDEYVGKKATVKFFERTVEGLPSHGHLMHKESPFLIEHFRPEGE